MSTKKNIEIIDNIIVGRVLPHIYAFSTNSIPNYLKVGDTCRPVSTRLNEWKKYFPDLSKIFENNATLDDGKFFFRDYSVHEFLENEKGKKRLALGKFPGKYFSNEFFENTKSKDIVEAIEDIKKNYNKHTGKYQYYGIDRLPEEYHYERGESWDLRPNQSDVVEKFKSAVNNDRTNLLMYAVMRFGKSFTAMCCANELNNAKIIVIVSAKADVKEEWKKTVESAGNFAKYKFLTEKELRNENAINDALQENERCVIFLTLQDLQGTTIKEKHQELFNNKIDLLIVDETHFGARANKYGEVLKDVSFKKDDDDFFDVSKADEITKKLNAKIKLHLSGTPYRILMSDEFKPEDIICFCQFTDIIDAQEKWDAKNQESDEQKEEWENPYFGFPQMIRFAFNPNESTIKKLEEVKKNGVTYAFSELFKPQSITKDEENGKHKLFVNEKEILDLLEIIDGSKEDDNLLGFLDYEKLKQGKMCRHIVCVLPYRASCDAFENLILTNKSKFKNLKSYEIINIAGVDDPTKYKDIKGIKTKIHNCEIENKKTITLTVNRMLTGSTVPEWDTMLYLKDTASPQEYDQSTFRLQNQFIEKYKSNDGKIIKYNMKPQTLLVDFDPNRMFRMQEEKSKIYNITTDKSGNTKLAERIKRELQISPIITINKDKIQEIQPADIMKAVSEYSKDKGVADEVKSIPIDLSLMSIKDIADEMAKQPELGSKQGLSFKAAEGDGDNLEVDDSTDNIDNDTPDSSSEQPTIETTQQKETPESIFAKQMQTYFARILFFAFLTKNKVKSLEDICAVIENNNENKRIAKHLGIKKNIVNLLHLHSNKFKLSDLDYKIQNINYLANDTSVEPIKRAQTAITKFSRLSTSEIQTPERICKEMISLISLNDYKKIVKEGGKILDIASKSGEFAGGLYSHLEKSCDKAKLKNCIYSIPTSLIAYEFTRKIYEILGLNIENIALKFNSYDLLNIKADNSNELNYNKINKFLTQNKKFSEIELTNEPIEGGNKVKFEAIVGNPPYQEMDGGAKASARPIYHEFVRIAKFTSSHFISLIMPSRWMAGGKGLNKFREEMLNDTCIEEIHDYLNPEEIFPNTNNRGGVCYLSRNNQKFDNDVKVVTYKNNKIISNVKRELLTDDTDILIRDFCGKELIERIFVDKNQNNLSTYISSRKPFGIDANITKTKDFSLAITSTHTISCLGKGMHLGYVNLSCVKTHENFINMWKVFIPRANNIGTELNDDNLNSFIGKPNSVCTESYLFVGINMNLNKNSSQNLSKYLKTKFARYFHSLAKASHDAPRNTYRFVPMQNFTDESDIDWSKSIPEIDQQLYKKYNLTDNEISFIESMIKSME